MGDRQGHNNMMGERSHVPFLIEKGEADPECWGVTDRPCNAKQVALKLCLHAPPSAWLEAASVY